MSLKRSFAVRPSQRSAPVSPRMQEMTVVKHFHSNPLRESVGAFPKVRFFKDLPDGSRYFHLHPVFKFVDNFLAGTTVGNNRASSGVIAKGKCKCLPSNNNQCVGGDTPNRSFVTKRSVMPQQQERVKVNLSNIESNNNLRVSLRGVQCPSGCECGDEAPSCPKKRDSQGTSSAYYVEQLKQEIQRSKTKIIPMSDKGDSEEYVKKLKEEVMSKKTKCLEEARNIINELQSEILNYRLQAKPRYSSSCSDFGSGDKGCDAQKTEKRSPTQLKQIGDSQGDVILSSPVPEDATRCVTLWQSKSSLPSSSDLDTTPREINFEEKLEEASSLIEKVREALKDIGKGINRIPEQKKQKTGSKGPSPEMKKEKVSTEKKKKQKRQEQVKANDGGRSVNAKQGPTKNGGEKEAKSSKKIEREEPPQVTEEVNEETTKKDEEPNQNIAPVQKKLQSISEISESEVSGDKINDTSKIGERPGKADRGEESPAVIKVERGSSPIKIESSPFVEILHTRVPSDDFPSIRYSIIPPPCEVPLVTETETSPILEETSKPPEPEDKLIVLSPSKTSVMKPKLSIQVLPPVSIRRGLTTQRTLNLCIKPTGSATNDLSLKKPNVGYQEVKIDGGSKENLYSQCPGDCRNTDGDYCQAKVTRDVHVEMRNVRHEMELVEKDVESIRENVRKMATAPQTKASRESASRHQRPPRLHDVSDGLINENALLLYRSFQILDDQTPDPPMKGKSVEQKKAPEMSDKHALLRAGRTPWEMGFYKSRATQCGGSPGSSILTIPEEETSKVPAEKEVKTPDVLSLHESEIRKTNYVNEDVSSWDDMPKSSSLEASPRTMTNSIVSEKIEEESDMSSQKLSLEEDNKPQTPKQSKDLSMTEIMSILNEGKKSLPKPEEPKEKVSPMTKLVRRSISISPPLKGAKDDSKLLPTKRSKEKKESLTAKISAKSVENTSSSSSGGYTDHRVSGSSSPSIDNAVSTPKKLEQMPTGTKRPYPDAEHQDNVMKIVKHLPEETETQDDKTNMKPQEVDGKKDHEVSKEEDEQKTDQNVQVSLAGSTTSSETDESSYVADRERANTIKYFIKGLTGTSQDQLEKLRSNPSFAKSDFPSWSRTHLRGMQDQSSFGRTDKPKDEIRKIRHSIFEAEEEVDIHDYMQKSPKPTPRQSNPSDFDDLSEAAKLKRLTEFQRKAGSSQGEEKIVMRVEEQRGDAGEGDDHLGRIFKAPLPFYRRVLGRIIDPDSKKPMRVSQSDANPVDESISEGEVKCRSSASIGEVHPVKHYDDRKKISRGTKHFKKHHEEIGDKSWTTARQRTQYNSWVAHYLKKRHTLSLIDDSSESPVSSSKK